MQYKNVINTYFHIIHIFGIHPDWVIRIESVIDAYSHGGVDFSPCFFRCGCKSELDFINQPVNSVSLAFKAEIDGFSGGVLSH